MNESPLGVVLRGCCAARPTKPRCTRPAESRSNTCIARGTHADAAAQQPAPGGSDARDPAAVAACAPQAEPEHARSMYGAKTVPHFPTTPPRAVQYPPKRRVHAPDPPVSIDRLHPAWVEAEGHACADDGANRRGRMSDSPGGLLRTLNGRATSRRRRRPRRLRS
jgi:hypothetical protein